MTFGEKVKNARLSLDFSQEELGAKIGVSKRSIFDYEQRGIFPRTKVLRKLAEALNVSVAYLMDEEETDKQAKKIDELFILNAKNEYGYKGAKEAEEVLTRASALFAGGELSEESKELFLQSLMEVYMDSKAEARRKFSGKQRASRKSSEQQFE